MRPADYVFGAALIGVISSNLYFGPRIAAKQLAMQWRLDGTPTWYAPKWIALWGMPAFMLIVRLVVWLGTTYAPKSVHDVDLGILIFAMTTAGAHLFTLMMAQRDSTGRNPS